MSEPRSRRELATPVNAPPINTTPDMASVSNLLSALPQLPAASHRGRIVKSAVNADFFDAETALAQAKAATMRMTAEVSDAVEQGREEGYAAGRATADEELATEMHRVQQQLATWQQDARATIVDLAIKVAGKLVDGFDVDELTRRGIEANVVKYMNDGPYNLQVSSDMLATAREALRGVEQSHPNATLPTVRLDTRLPERRAVLVTRFGSVDLDIQSQLDAIRVSLLASGQHAYRADGDGTVHP